MTGEHPSDYVRTDELADALVPLDVLIKLYQVSRRTLERWLNADSITRHSYHGGKAVRWGDLPKPGTHATRWNRVARDGVASP